MNYDDIVVCDFVLRIIWRNCRARIQDDLERDEVYADAYYCSGYFIRGNRRLCKNDIADSFSYRNRIFV